MSISFDVLPLPPSNARAIEVKVITPDVGTSEQEFNLIDAVDLSICGHIVTSNTRKSWQKVDGCKDGI